MPLPLDRKSTRLNSSHTEIYTLSLHDALPISASPASSSAFPVTRATPCWPISTSMRRIRCSNAASARSEEHTSELQSHRDLHSFPTRRSSDLGFTRFIIGVPRDESDAMLAYLYQHAENPLFQCRFRWSENAIAFWDNRCAQHRAMWDYWPHTRSGTRVTVKGERPV